MSRVYNKAFKIGVAFNVLIFAILNIWSLVAEKRAFEASSIRLGSSFFWGFPFAWAWDTGIGLGFMLNVAVIACCSFVVGFLFRYLAGEGSK